ncbi:hypothetical protein EHS25_003201 [Saitozyma podzolica]|uniref:Uncharacterized protein n=1 Tax=Saitozyma podzolica TaxID=1890683 RepID=A0A427Y859_9TREE|nr:hypothetical protein EHS25_003201 [Saitozyma podzolica]
MSYARLMNQKVYVNCLTAADRLEEAWNTENTEDALPTQDWMEQAALQCVTEMLEHGDITHDKHIRSCILIRSWLSDIPLDDYYDWPFDISGYVLELDNDGMF